MDLRYNIRGWLTSINNATLTADGGGGVGVMNDNPDGIQNVSNSYYDNTPSSMNVFNWFQPTTEQLVNSAFNNTPAGTNAFYSGNGTLLQSGYSGSMTLQSGGPVIYNEYVDDYVPAYLITMNGGVNTNKELYERALRAISDWGGAPDLTNEFDEINRRYGDDFMKYFTIPTAYQSFESNAIGKNYLERFMFIAKYSQLADKDESLPDLMVVGYDIISEEQAHGNTVSSVTYATDIIPRSTWTSPIYENPSRLYSTGIGEPLWFPTQSGTVGLRIYFQFVPNF